MAAYVDESMDKNLDGDSLRWNNWMSALSITSCKECKDSHGKIYGIQEMSIDPIPRHLRCVCKIVQMRTKSAGTATKQGINGADWYLAYYGFLPEGYVTKDEAEDAGWKKREGNLADVLPKVQIGGDIYYNRNGKLPRANNRIWYEADINYE